MCSSYQVHVKSLLRHQGKPQAAMKRRKRACQTSIDTHPASAPEGRPPAGSRSSREKNNSLYSRSTRRLPPSLRTGREDQKIHSWVSRIYNHQPGWIRWLFWEPKQETTTIEM
ncbi:hypothetical protein V8C34DRAFT_270122, partial [Trichoderma compactum]